MRARPEGQQHSAQAQSRAAAPKEQTMSDSRNQLENFVGPSESLRMMEALKGGATRRDVLKMLLAGACRPRWPAAWPVRRSARMRRRPSAADASAWRWARQPRPIRSIRPSSRTRTTMCAATWSTTD
ncbi:hypothetical protein CBM2609_A70500 [Cupriavidus taiwanensis]|nr:hypothetical protein CBM2604_A60498 [Cupriavidus taiwanensis]SOZ29207.1 hypothetical protein CBM2609_A70500 [Cupriavidus taiwanensis]SOZ46671.1 hypothetical protein CBM2610_A80458 [Cupriavidus taiwanensis]